MRICRLISKKKYLGGKAVYRYERFYVPVPTRFHSVIKPLLGRDVKIKVESAECDKDGLVVRLTISAPHQSVSKTAQ